MLNNKQLEIIKSTLTKCASALRSTLSSYISTDDIDGCINFSLGAVRCPKLEKSWQYYADEEKNKLIEDIINDTINEVLSHLNNK